MSLDDAESFAIEYWPLELYKLSLAPAPRELQGAVALITGAAGGIGSAVARALVAEGACVVAADLDLAGASTVASELGDVAIATSTNVLDEASVVDAYRAAVLAFGGIDVVVSNAGIASSAPIEDTTLEIWDRNNDILARGYFLVAREAARVLRAQGTGGSIVFIGSKNALAPGKNGRPTRPRRLPRSTSPAVSPRSLAGTASASILSIRMRFSRARRSGTRLGVPSVRLPTASPRTSWRITTVRVRP